MEDRIKVSYEQIEKANKEIQTLKLGTKGYAQVNERVKAFRKVYPMGSIETQIEKIEDNYVRIKCSVCDENDNLLATGTASEINDGKNRVNATSMIENCETSAIGRALGFAGFGVDVAIASAEDMERAKEKNKRFEIYTDMYIPDEEAKKIIKVSIGELMRKMGVVKASLENVVEKELWTSLSDLSSHQLRKLEERLKTLNMENNPWHDLYNENTKIKDVVPENQEVVYESSWYKFGKLALEMAGTDELLRNDIINSFLEYGFNLEA